jgi:hypothetical protein
MLKDQLLEELAPLNLNLARLKCLMLLLTSLLRHRTVNLTILATENLTGAKNESCYRRFQNFFLHASLCLSSVGRLILNKLPKPKKGWVLSMDRTNWKFGKIHINILTVGVIVNNVAIPIAWTCLPKKTKRGNSSTKHRITIFKRILKLLEANEIEFLAMDREFGGEKWLSWLDKQGVAYIVRVKSNTVVGNKLAHQYHSTRSKKSPYELTNVWGMNVFFACKTITSKGKRGERLHVISNRFSGPEMLELYKQRWGIELLFSHLKKRGFNLEDTHMTSGTKIEKLFAIVTLGFLFCYAWGCELRSISKQTKATKRKSHFRLGIEDILRMLNNPHLNEKELTSFIRWLKQPFWGGIFVV